MFLLLLAGAGLFYHHFHRAHSGIVTVQEMGTEELEGVRIIDRILMRRAEAIDYVTYCPDLPFRMYRIQKIMGIDIRTLSIIADIEGGTVSPTMQRAKNLWGLSANEKIIVYDDWDYSIYKACILIRNISANSVDSLASRWCPVNQGQWADNFMIVYLWSIKEESKKSNGCNSLHPLESKRDGK